MQQNKTCNGALFGFALNKDRYSQYLQLHVNSSSILQLPIIYTHMLGYSKHFLEQACFLCLVEFVITF